MALVSLYLNVAQCFAPLTVIQLSVTGGWGWSRVGGLVQGGQLDSQKKEQLEEINLNFLLSSNGCHPYVLHLPLLFAVSWATWDTVKGILF